MEVFSTAQINKAQFSEDVRFAVRYGYQYRLVAEENAEEENGLKYNLPAASDFLYWLANMVISGVAFEIIKTSAVALWQKLKQSDEAIPEDVNKIMVDDEELKRFVHYVDEFNLKNLSATEKEILFIREEIIADYVGDKAGEIYEKYHRAPKQKEFETITKEAIVLADRLLKKARQASG